MFRSCFESSASVVPIKLVRAAHCGAPRIATHRTYIGICGKKNDWQFSNPRIDTVSPFLFILAIDWIMKTETKGKRNGIQWKMLTQLDDLAFADDLALMSHSHRQMQDKKQIWPRFQHK